MLTHKRMVMIVLLSAFCTHAAAARFERFTYEGRSQEAMRPAAGEYLNPILPGYYPDPSIVRVGADYYLIHSSFAHFPGIPIFHSRDLVSWVQIGNAIDRPGQLRFDNLGVSRGVFAPDISYHDGLFYIVNTCVDCGGNFVITARDPRGPWSDPVWFEFDGIDPSIFWDGDTAYIVNNGPPNEPPRYDGHRAIWVQQFDYRKLRLVGERTQIVNGGVDISKQPSWIEGPHLLKHGEDYLLIAAEGGTGDNHSEVVFRSKSVRGPFVPYEHNPILSQRGMDPNRPHPITSAGHAKLVQTQTGQWWATFLATRPYEPGRYNIGRETFLLPVSWKDGWPIILPPNTAIPFVARRPDLPAQAPPHPPINGDFAYVDEFDSPALSPAWIGVRTPRRPFFELEHGALVLHSSAKLGDVSGVPAFIGRRQQHHIARVATTLTYTPQHDGDRAGLVAIQNDDAWLFFGIAMIEGQPKIALIARENSKQERLIASRPLTLSPSPRRKPGPPSSPNLTPANQLTPHSEPSITLTLRASGGVMSFDYEMGNRRETLQSDVDVRFLSTQAAGGFVGTVIGPYLHEHEPPSPEARGPG